MQIVECTDSHHEAWNAFVSASPRASFYHRYEWRGINERCFGHRSSYLAALEGSRVLGVFPMVHVKTRLFSDMACSLPFVNHGGPCGVSGDVERELVRAAAVVAAGWGVEFLEIRSRRHLGAQFPTSEHKISMTVDLSDGIAAIWRNFTSAHRQDIRGGYKKGFSAAFGGEELIDRFYDVLSEAWRDRGTPIYAKSYLQAVARTFPNMVRICVVSRAGTPAAASFQAYDGHTAEGLWLGSRASSRHEHAGYVLYWELLKDAAEHGCRRFHLGRSTSHSGNEAFKRKWNATPTQLYWQYILRTRASIPQVNVDNRRYKLAVWAWRRLPLPVTTRVGPLLARGIP